MAERLDRLVESNLRRNGLWDTTMRHMAVNVWREAVGERITAHSQAVGVMGSTLLVRVENPSWRQQLHLMRPSLVSKVNERLGGPYIEDIRLTARKSLLAEMEPPARTVQAVREWPGPGALATVVLTTREARDIDQSAERVGDQRLRAACKKFLITTFRRRHLLESWGLQKCQVCGSLTDGTICGQCVAEINATRQRRATGVLSRLPWLDVEGLRSVDPELGEPEYRVARDTLIAMWTKEASWLAASRAKKNIPGLRLLLANMAMLLTHTPPENLTDVIICGAIPERLYQRAGFGAAQSRAQ